MLPSATILAVGAGLDLQVEDVRGVAFVEDEEDLGEVAIACGGFEDDDLVDARFQKDSSDRSYWAPLWVWQVRAFSRKLNQLTLRTAPTVARAALSTNKTQQARS